MVQPGGGGLLAAASVLFMDDTVDSCPWDIHENGSVGAGDLLVLLGFWGPCKDCPADFDNDGNVGAPDLLALLANWGPCP